MSSLADATVQDVIVFEYINNGTHNSTLPSLTLLSHEAHPLTEQFPLERVVRIAAGLFLRDAVRRLALFLLVVVITSMTELPGPVLYLIVAVGKGKVTI